MKPYHLNIQLDHCNVNQEVHAALAVSHQLSQQIILQELRQLTNIIIHPHSSYGNNGVPSNTNEDRNTDSKGRSRLRSSFLRVASPSLLNSAIQSVDCLEQCLESIIHYSWEEEEDDDDIDDDDINDTNEELGNRIPSDIASLQQQIKDDVLSAIVILREYIARCSLLSLNIYGGSDIANEKIEKNDDDHDDENVDGSVDDGGEKNEDIGDKFLQWAIAAKHAGLMQDCILAHKFRMSVDPRLKQLDAVRLLGIVDNNDVQCDSAARGKRGCNIMIEIEESPTKGLFESVPHQISLAKNNELSHLLPTRTPSTNATLLGKRVYEFFHSMGFNYWNCRRMLIDVLSLNDEQKASERWNRMYSANVFFEHRHEIYHSLQDPDAEVNRAGGEEPWRALACLFLFGISLKQTEVSSSIGEDITVILIDAGLLRNNPVDTRYLVSEVQIYPLDTGIFEWSTEDEADSSSSCVYCMTDWSMESLRSPRNAVMTIGYDSLELMTLTSGKNVFDGVGATSRVLDLCCGCGIQGIFAAKRSSTWSNSSVRTELVAMDINVRAVRFAMANACLNGLFVCDDNEGLCGTTSFMYSAIEADVYEPVECFPVVDRLSRQIGRFDCIICNPPFVAVPIAKNMTSMAPALYAVGGGHDGMNILRRILHKCFDILNDGMHRQLLMVTELPNIETSCELLSCMLPTTASVSVAYIKDDVEMTYDYAKRREGEAGFDIVTRDWRPPSNQIVNRALALISISRAVTPDLNLFCYRAKLESAAVSESTAIDEEDQFLTNEGIKYVRDCLL